MKPARPTPPKDAGLSLVEMMVALAIISALAGVVALNMAAAPEPARAEAEHLAARFEAARTEALVAGGIIGFSADGDGRGYGFLEYGRTGWRPMTDHPALESRRFKAERLTIAREGAARRENGDDAPAEPAPEVWFDPAGTGEGWSYALEGGGEAVRVRYGAQGARVEAGR